MMKGHVHDSEVKLETIIWGHPVLHVMTLVSFKYRSNMNQVIQKTEKLQFKYSFKEMTPCLVHLKLQVMKSGDL